MAPVKRKESSEDPAEETTLRAGQTVKIEGILSLMEVERTDEGYVAIGPHGGEYELIDQGDRIRAKAGTSSRGAELVSDNDPRLLMGW